MKNAFKDFLLICFGTLLGLFLIEILLSIYNPLPARVIGNEIRLVSNYERTIVIDNDFQMSGLDESIQYSTNSIGFRGDEPPSDFDQYHTIFTVGGSTTECSLLDDTKTWSHLLNNRLSNDFDSIWLNNSGIDGCSTYGHQMLLSEHIYDYQPKMILFLVGINEIYASAYKDEGDVFLQSGPKFRQRKLVQKSKLMLFLWNLYKLKVARKKMGHATKKVPENLTKKEFEEQNAFYRKDQEAYKKRIGKIVEDCIKRNITPVLVTQPVYQLTPYHPHVFVKYYNETTREVGKKNNLMVINLDKKLPDDPQFYYDAVHYTNKGAAKVAEIIYDELKNHETLPAKEIGK